MGKRRILICDDEEGVRESLKLILEDRYAVELAEHGEDAMQRLAASRYDLLVLDLKMPKLDGIESIKQVRQLSRTMPILIVTAYQSADIAQEVFRLGANDYLSKPFERADVLSVVEKLLSKPIHT